MPKVKFTLDGTKGLIQELVSDDSVSELIIKNLDQSAYATTEYVDTAVGTGGNISLTGSNIFGSSPANTHQFSGSVNISGSLTTNQIINAAEINTTNFGTIFSAGNIVAAGGITISGNSFFSGDTNSFINPISGELLYSASIPSHWSGSSPQNVNAAINRIAAAVASLLSSSIP